MDQQDLFSSLNKEKIIFDLFQAYFDARKNKRNTINALAFEKDFEANLFSLADEIIERRYSPKSSICFIVTKPVRREIFAADFRDRIIHHFIYNYISPISENTFINDTYSCRVGKGTHYGIKRADRFIRSCSQNYVKDCFILKIDIKGYFMAINKKLLYNKVKDTILKHRLKIGFDLPLVLYLIERTIFNEPAKDCQIKGSRNDWSGLPESKSLFHARKDCGLPIGNLTSQLFGNIYLNDFDHWVKRDLGIHYYCRYVDDILLIHNNKAHLLSCIQKIKTYLDKSLELQLHPDKIYLQHFSKGVRYLGTVIKPHRIYIANRTKGNFYSAIKELNEIVKDHKPAKEDNQIFLSRMNSYLGIMKHYRTYKLRKEILQKNLSGWWWNQVYLTDAYSKFILKHKRP